MVLVRPDQDAFSISFLVAFMLIKSKYKIARRLGTPIFEKTQTQKFALAMAKRKEKSRKHQRTLTDFGRQLLEKQKVRYTYLINERQLKKYVRNVLTKRGVKQDEKIFEILELRLDNVAYRLGFGPTRLAVRQLVTHGHLCVNGKRVNIPSYTLKASDVVSVRAQSLGKKVFFGLAEKLKEVSVPGWLTLDLQKHAGTVKGLPKLEAGVTGLDFNTVLEFYKR